MMVDGVVIEMWSGGTDRAEMRDVGFFLFGSVRITINLHTHQRSIYLPVMSTLLYTDQHSSLFTTHYPSVALDFLLGVFSN